MRVGKLSIRSFVVMAAMVAMVGAVLVVAPPQDASAFPGSNGEIAFGDSGTIRTVNADGTGSAPFATQATEAAWSPDGEAIAFTDTSTGDFNIWTLNGARGQISTGDSDHNAAWSPDGEWIAFNRGVTLTAETGLATQIDAPGTTLHDSTAGAFANAAIGMTVTKTGGGSADIVGVTATSVSTDPTTPIAGGWAVGDAYTITSEQKRVWKIESDDTTGATATQLSAAGATDFYDDYVPAWSPDGTKIAFATDRNGNDDVYVMLAAGEGAGSVVNLTPDGSLQSFDDKSWDPAWSPDGTKIAFASGETGLAPPNDSSAENLWIMNADGTSKVGLTTPAAPPVGTDKDEAPAWSPDGTALVFERNDASIVTIPAAGGTPTSIAAPGTNPDWRPVLAGVADAYPVEEDALLVVPVATGVLANDGLFAVGVGVATAVKDTDPTNGTLTLAADGSFTYDHNGSDTTTDSFTYHPMQGGVAGAVATVTITINPVNDPPVAVGDSYSVVRGESRVVAAPGVLGNDSDPEGSGLTAEKKSDPSHGSLVFNVDGSFTYVNNGDAAASDSFTYVAKDGVGAPSNVATVSLTISDEPVGVHLTGLVDPGSGKWYLYDDAGALVASFFYGNPGDYPFMGDWDGDGVETPGLYRQSDGYVYLRNSNTVGVADIRFFFGDPGDVPVAGDFNGDGFDTVSIYRPSSQTFFIINKLGANDGGLGAADTSYVFGNPGDKPFVGDFDGDGVETAGLHRESTGLVYFRNSHTQGNADAQFIFGDPGDRLIAGDWTGDSVFTPALFRPSNTTTYFRWTNTQGIADNQFIAVPVNPTWLPVSGTR